MIINITRSSSCRVVAKTSALWVPAAVALVTVLVLHLPTGNRGQRRVPVGAGGARASGSGSAGLQISRRSASSQQPF